MTVRYCVDCKHFKDQDETCTHPDFAISIDYVFGKSSFMTAKEMREPEANCGPEGKLFRAIRYNFLKVDWE